MFLFCYTVRLDEQWIEVCFLLIPFLKFIMHKPTSEISPCRQVEWHFNASVKTLFFWHIKILKWVESTTSRLLVRL